MALSESGCGILIYPGIHKITSDDGVAPEDCTSSSVQGNLCNNRTTTTRSTSRFSKFMIDKARKALCPHSNFLNLENLNFAETLKWFFTEIICLECSGEQMPSENRQHSARLASLFCSTCFANHESSKLPLEYQPFVAIIQESS